MRLRLALFFLLLAAPALAKKAPPPPPPVEIALEWKTGTVLYQTTPTAQLERVTGTQIVKRDSFVTTGPSSLGILVYPDKSHVVLGEGTTVQVGAFEARGSRASSFIRIPPTGGVVRFDINHQSNGESDYVFATSLARITVRGTSAMLSDGIGGDTITCLVCEAGDVVARLGARDFALLTGDTMHISPRGHVTIDKTREAVLAAFAAAGLSTQIPPTPTPQPRRRFHLPKIKL